MKMQVGKDARLVSEDLHQVVSIIVPTYNEASGVEGLLAQLRRIPVRSELIVVDGGSWDDTVALAQPLADRVLVSDVAGRAVQMNAGANAAVGEILWFVHADTVLLEPLAAYAEILQARPLWGFFPLRLSGGRRVFRLLELLVSYRSRWTRVATGDQGIFVSRRLFGRLNGYAEQPLMEDVELSKRLRSIVAPVVAKQCVVTDSRRWETFGVPRTVLLMWCLRLFYFCGASPEWLAARYPRQGD